tara:strand:- start:1839 stop:2594 length:756 start_codon:yes stop_codon:yes gene_type:complete
MIKGNILLIGGSGNLGQKIIKSNLFGKIYHPKKNSLNLLKPDQIDKFLNLKKVDIIINCASIARMKECEKNKSKAINNNILGTFNLVSSILKFNKNKRKNVLLVHISTDAVYPSIKGNYSEDSGLGPYNVYGWTKLSAEYLVKILEKHIIIRTRFYDKKKIKYKFSASDIFTSQVDIRLLPKYIKYLILEKYSGVINIGGKRISDFNLYKKDNKKLKPFKRKNLIKKLKFTIAKDSSLNIKKFKKIKNKYE